MFQTDESGLLTGQTQYPVKGYGDVAVTPPAVPAGHAARWISTVERGALDYGEPGTGEWTVLEDHRKDTLWIARGQPYTIGDDHGGQSYDGIGPLPAWLSATEPPAPEPTPAELRTAKIDSATARRWDVMTGGLSLPGGIVVGTTIDDQNRITSVVANAELAGLTDTDEVDFKAISGWVSISISEVKAIAGAIGQFVQACYTAERAHHEAINALESREEIESYDVTTGWPSGSQA